MLKHLFAIAILGSLTTVHAKSDKPNILFIFADDMSYETIGAYGLLDIDTPHLDKMVEAGTTFTHAYNMGAYNGAVCVASRAMLNTGRFVWNTYAHDTGPKMKKEVQDRRMWSQLMNKAGYRTYMTGKWHVKAKPEDIFDVAVHERPGMPNQTPEGYNRPVDEEDYKNGWKPWETKYEGFWKGGKHWSEVVADDSIDFLNDAKTHDEPFFMYLAFNAAHDPRQAPKEYVDRYPLDRVKLPENFVPKYKYQDEIGCGEELRDARLAPFPRTEYSVKVNRQEYFALITHMDDQIGRILKALEETGQADNTYIVFTADHGLAIGHHGLIGKQNMYDHSVRVPFMVVGPNVKKGEKNNAPIYLQDIMPTALDLAGAPIPDDVEFKSLLPMLNGKKKHYDSIYGAYKGQQRMICKDDWKFIHYPTANANRLYNMNADPFEQNDLAMNPEYAAKVKELKTDLLELSADLSDPLDYNNPAESWKKATPSKKQKTTH
ncbi:sulfatase-like hydrolase/transferase [Pontiella sulfatireligans]|uniref:Arylsulfatase n=1 Tax=Pontiella sulfatireligans TaxID=2750658 RepID=A0A6C2UWG0_9BACT|nr:sulfatase-like hydrolase/transferase [Pontiella sulfatireligans]SPS74552.1 sulfatase S1_28 [Kiritimatiellales bacterium]VGO23176.1 Arylsulfatase [Pontiella sulfatireligans]